MIKTKHSIEAQIKNTKYLISLKESEMMTLKSELLNLENSLEALKAYEQTPIAKRTLKIYIFDTTRSITIMDDFESLTKDGFQKYERMIISNGYHSSCGVYNFIVERLNGRESIGNITMTEFKKGLSYSLQIYAQEEIKKQLQDAKRKSGMEIIFEKPYLLRAQNSSNRTGYGSEYNGYDLVYQGTLYGETTNYAFVGVILV
jgi:hypothetical protein